MQSAGDSSMWDVDARHERMLSLVDGLKEKDEIRMVFICLGNICRSPYAEMQFERLVSENGNCNKPVIVSSGGFIKQTVVIHELTKKALLDAGIPKERVERFHSRPLRKHKEELVAADILVAPTRSVIEVQLQKKYHHKAFLLSEIGEAGIIDIEDPALIKDYGKYKDIIHRIDPHLEHFLALLKARGAC